MASNYRATTESGLQKDCTLGGGAADFRRRAGVKRDHRAVYGRATQEGGFKKFCMLSGRCDGSRAVHYFGASN
jgi:hypothetical protein